MRSLVYVAAVGALLAASSANAAVKLSFTPQTGSSLDWIDSTETPQAATFPNGGYVVSTNPVTKLNGKPVLDKNNNPEFANYGGSLTSNVKVKNQTASFTSGVAARGPSSIDEGTVSGASATATSGVIATLTNTGRNAVTLDSIDSEIIQAGMGFMVQKTTGNAVGADVFTGYGVDPNGSFGDLNKTGHLNTQIIGTAGFTFDVYGADYATTPDVLPLYQITGSVSLGFDSEGNVFEFSQISDAQSTLTNFQAVYPDPDGLNNSDNMAGYEWDATDITIGLNNFLLAAGQSTQLYYVASSYVDISDPCPSDKECLVGYSGFGDPVGRGGGVSDFALFQSDARSSSTCPDDNSEICFSPQSVTPFSNLDFTKDGGGVPEPATWALMIMGFGLTGAALRRRRVLSYS
jgi:hypothetical protein